MLRVRLLEEQLSNFSTAVGKPPQPVEMPFRKRTISLQMAITALVASLNPSIVARQNTGTDSEALQQLQHDLLKVIHKQHPQAMYPAALCTLADLVEVCPYPACFGL